MRAERNERVLVTTLTKKMAEDLTDYFAEVGVRVRYLHSDIETLERIKILRDLRRGEFDVLVGINLLREGWTCPKSRSSRFSTPIRKAFCVPTQSLIQTMGRAARNVRRQSDSLCRQDHRFDAARDRRNPPPPRRFKKPTTRSTASRRRRSSSRSKRRWSRRMKRTTSKCRLISNDFEEYTRENIDGDDRASGSRDARGGQEYGVRARRRTARPRQIPARARTPVGLSGLSVS